MGGRAAAAGALATAAGVMGYAVRGRSSSLLAPSVYRGDRRRRAIALTFDDGPSESTGEVLEVLERYNVKATFFQCGANVRRLPGVAREVAAAGHEIGNHSYSHPRLDFQPARFIHRELAEAQDAIRQTTGVQPCFFRAPFGVRWFGLGQAQKRLGLMGVMWTTIGVDWKSSENRIAWKLAAGAANGAIFCLHDGRELQPRPDVRATIGAVRKVIAILRDQGFHFEKVSEILCPTI